MDRQSAIYLIKNLIFENEIYWRTLITLLHYENFVSLKKQCNNSFFDVTQILKLNTILIKMLNKVTFLKNKLDIKEKLSCIR